MSIHQRGKSVSPKVSARDPDENNSSPGSASDEDSLLIDDDRSYSSRDSSYLSLPAVTESCVGERFDAKRPPVNRNENLLVRRAVVYSAASTEDYVKTTDLLGKTSPSDTVDGQNSSTPTKNTYIHVGCFVALLVALLVPVCILASHWSTDQDSPHTSAGPISQFTKAFQNIKGAFPEQSKNFWTVLGAGTKSIITNENPERPAVFILVVPSDASDTADCLVRNFSSTITQLFNAKHPVEFTPRNVDVLTPEKIKHQLDDKLDEGLSSGSRVAVVHHLEHLPGESAGMLHGYCDDSNAPYRRVVYFLTLHVDELTSSVKESDSFVHDRLKTLWGDQLGTNRFDPLLARIAGSIAFVRPERSHILRKNMC